MKIKSRLDSKPLEKKQIEKMVVAAIIDKPLVYEVADEAIRAWADNSFFWIVGEERTLQVVEPLMVSALQKAMDWDPTRWIVDRITNEPGINASQHGIDFEQVSARKLAMALSNGTISIQDSSRNDVKISKAPNGATVGIIKATKSMSLDDFLSTPQCTHMFLPANKDGPDVVFWMMSADDIWYAVFLQSKFYKDKISGQSTVAAVKTVLKKGNLGSQYRRLQVFFPFLGATCTAKPNVLHPWCDKGNNVYIYLHYENDGKRVLGDDVCEQLYAVKKQRADAP